MESKLRMNPELKPGKASHIFVGGPILHAVSDGKYHPPLRQLITGVISVLEDAGYGIFSAHRAEGFGLDERKFCCNEIAIRDFDWMNRCEIFVAILPAADEGILRTDGTHVELGWASALGKPIVAVVPLPLPDKYSPLLHGLKSVARVQFVDISELQKRPALLLDVLQSKMTV